MNRIFALLIPIFLNAGFFDWFDDTSLQAKGAEMTLNGFEAEIEKALHDFQVPGIAIGVVVDGHLVFAKGFGVRDIDSNLPVDKDTLFAMGSCTKAFTTFAMGSLVDEGAIFWDQPVIDVLPNFRLKDQYATANLTIRDLLTHRSGMPRHEFIWYNSKMDKKELLRRIRYLEPSYDIRERYQYGNLMYFVAGLAMESVTGKTWENLVSEKILEPLEMSSTNFSVADMQRGDNFAFPHLEKHGLLKKLPFRDLSLIAPAGAMNSNVSDMSRWIKMNLASGIYNDRSLINNSTLREIFAPQVIVPGAIETKEAHLLAYGIGWTVASYRGHYYVSHDGVSDGFTSMVGLFPDDHIGIVVLSNKNMTTLPRYVSFEIADRVLGLSHHDWFKEGLDSIRRVKISKEESLNKEDLTRKKGTSLSHPIEAYLGVYEHPGYGVLKVDLVDGKLQATYNDLEFILDHWHYDVFSVVEEKQDIVVSFEGTKIRFINNEDGDIDSLSVPFEQAAGDIVFKKKVDGVFSEINYLRNFIGTYEIYGYVVDIVMRNQSLIAIIPGQPNYELIPVSENEFNIKGMIGSTVRFVIRNDVVEEVLLIHPYGAFSATPKNRQLNGL